MSETLWYLRGRVRDVRSRCTPDMVDGFLNKRIQSVVNKRTWSDLMRVATIVIPGAYTTGRVALTAGSKRVIGTGTSWPFNDGVATQLTAAITDSPGMVDEITPASMVGINVGDNLVLDVGTVSQEIVVVSAVTAVNFTAYCLFTHGSSATIRKSSLAGLQFHAPNNAVSTVRAVLDAGTIELDQPYGGAALTNQQYQIYLGYTRISATARRLLWAWDPLAGQTVGTNKTTEWLSVGDPQRTASGDPQELVSTYPSEGGVMQWEIWPAQRSARMLQVVYQDGWPRLRADNDRSPHFMNAEVFIAGALADARRARVVLRGEKQDPEHDPSTAAEDERQFESLQEDAIQADQGRYLTHLQDYQLQIQGGANYNYQRSHAPWPSGM